MKKVNEHFPSKIPDYNDNTTIRANNIQIPSEIIRAGGSGVSKSMQLPGRAYSTSEIILPEGLFNRSVGNQSFNMEKHQKGAIFPGKEVNRPHLNQSSWTGQPGLNSIQPIDDLEDREFGICHTDVDEDLDDEDTLNTLSLRNNLTSKILTEGRFSLFNNKIQQFNHEKTRTISSSCFTNNSFVNRNYDISRASFGLTVNTELLPQGPKTFFPAELRSPKPKENSLDEINDMLDFSDDEGIDQHQSLDETQKIPLKDYLEISQVLEKSIILNPEGEVNRPSEQRMFSRESRDDSDHLDLPDSDEEDKAVNINTLKNGNNGFKLIEAESETLSDNDALEILIKAIFDHKIDSVIKIIKKYPSLINLQDALGNSPLNLTVKLAYKHLDYFAIAKFLLASGASPKLKDINGWSCLDEVICQADVMLLSVIFDHLINYKKKILIKQQQKLIDMLSLTPDFYLEMKWDFESSIIPFFSKLAPSDTFKIWKHSKYLRMDSTLAGFKRLSIKRRDMSLIFNPDINMPPNFKAGGSLYNVNRTKSQYTNPLQDVDVEEKKYMMYDMLKADPLQGSFNIKRCHWQEHKGIFGNTSNQKVNDWDTKRFDFKLDLEYTLFKKAKTFFKETYESYQNNLQIAKFQPLQKVSSRDPREILNQLKQRNGVVTSANKKPSTNKDLNQLKIENINLDTFENAQVTEKKAEAFIWLARNFPMKFDALSPVIQFLSNGNNLLQKVESLLSREEVKALMSENAFPVKIQVPITLSIKANITITKYELIKDPNVKELFSIPKNFAYVDRKDAQKTLQRTKKRMVLVNVLT